MGGSQLPSISHCPEQLRTAALLVVTGLQPPAQLPTVILNGRTCLYLVIIIPTSSSQANGGDFLY
jgi:hypothetical protein